MSKTLQGKQSESTDDQELQLYDVAEIQHLPVPAIQMQRSSENSVILEKGESGNIIKEDADSLDNTSSAFEFIDTPKVSVHSSPAPSFRVQQEVFMIKNLDTNERVHVDEYVKPMDLSTFHEAKKAWSAEVMVEENKEIAVKKDEEHVLKKEGEGWMSAVLALAGQKSNRAEDRVSNKVAIKVHKKGNSEFGSLRLLQAIEAQMGPIWTMKFSPDANYLAAAGSDGAVRIWAVLGSPADVEFAEQLARRKNNPSEISPDEKAAEFFAEKSKSTEILEGREILNLNLIRTFKGHSSDVVDISWSPSNFLLSASLDKSVRLWHVSKDKCLGKFQHADFVTSVAFHPTNSRYFLTGSYDRILRIWSIIEHRVTVYEQTDSIITSSAFSPDGKFAVAGLISGQCVIYKTDGLVYSSQIDCKNRHGKFAKGRKVTGLQFLDNKQLLVTTCDSRIRLFDMEDRTMKMKFKGLLNEKLPIRASFSEDGRYVICGSEDQEVYIWNSVGKVSNSVIELAKDHNAQYEHFKAHDDSCTVALFVPRQAIEFSSALEVNKIKHMFVSAGFDGTIRFYESRHK